jgi:hypothetical protein
MEKLKIPTIIPAVIHIVKKVRLSAFSWGNCRTNLVKKGKITPIKMPKPTIARKRSWETLVVNLFMVPSFVRYCLAGQFSDRIVDSTTDVNQGKKGLSEEPGGRAIGGKISCFPLGNKFPIINANILRLLRDKSGVKQKV